jgi:hypothetical protein
LGPFLSTPNPNQTKRTKDRNSSGELALSPLCNRRLQSGVVDVCFSPATDP